MRQNETNYKALLREYLGRWPIVSGALSLWIGLLLAFMGPSYLRHIAYEGIAIGIAFVLIGFAVRRAFRV